MTTSLNLKEEGMQRSAENNADALSIARDLAILIALGREDRCCHMDMVRQRMPTGITLGNAAGSVFKGSYWEFSGRRICSTHACNHGRELKVWTLTHDCEEW